jgi:hypothetical protein
MNELLDYSSLYEYDYTHGTSPGTQADVEQTKPYDVSEAGTVKFGEVVESTDPVGNNKTDQGLSKKKKKKKTDQGILYSLSCSLLNFLISSQNS